MSRWIATLVILALCVAGAALALAAIGSLIYLIWIWGAANLSTTFQIVCGISALILVAWSQRVIETQGWPWKPKKESSE